MAGKPLSAFYGPAIDELKAQKAQELSQLMLEATRALAEAEGRAPTDPTELRKIAEVRESLGRLKESIAKLYN
jgi:hypothetical protein